jgi:flavoprotein
MRSFSKYANLVLAFLLLGVVDQIHGRSIHVELTDRTGQAVITDLPLWMFPCDIEEGSIFYFTKVDNVLELRCGEPPE